MIEAKFGDDSWKHFLSATIKLNEGDVLAVRCGLKTRELLTWCPRGSVTPKENLKSFPPTCPPPNLFKSQESLPRLQFSSIPQNSGG